MFLKAGGAVPWRNVERLLRDTGVPVSPEDSRRLDLVVSGIDAFRGLPLLCDAFCVLPVTGAGDACRGSLTIDGGAVQRAQRTCHEVDYPEVAPSEAGHLLALGVETFGRWSTDALEAVRTIALHRCHGLPSRLRQGVRLRLLRRWWGLLGLAVQREVARAVSRGRDADLVDTGLEAVPGLAELVWSER